MRDLTPKVRAHMPKSEFAGPGTSYPVPDAAHAKLAKAMVAKFGSPALKARVDAKANAELRRSK